MSGRGRTMGEVLEAIGHYVANLKFETLPEDVVARAGQVVLDTLGTAIAGYGCRLGRLAAEYAATQQSGSEATLIGDGRLSSLEGAAWANAVMAKHLGMDDTHRVCGHVAAELVPVILAIGELKHLDGRAAITALAAGYDVFSVIQPAVETFQRERGLDHKGQAGTLASAVSAAVALGLDEAEIANALALSVDMACGTEQYVYEGHLCDTKDLLSGYAARNGIFAAKLAAFGFKGPSGALEGPYGYYHAFGNGYDSKLLDSLGKDFALATTGFKPHAGCRHVHPCVDATLALLRKGKPKLKDIVSIEVGTYKAATTPSFRVNYKPQDVGQASYSIPVAVSVVLVRGSWYPDDIAAYDQPEIRRLRSSVKVDVDPDIEAAYPEKNGCIVRIKTKNGEVYEGRVDYAKGEPEDPLTNDEIVAKFERLTGKTLAAHQIHSIIRSALKLEALQDVGKLVRLTVIPRRENA